MGGGGTRGRKLKRKNTLLNIFKSWKSVSESLYYISPLLSSGENEKAILLSQYLKVPSFTLSSYAHGLCSVEKNTNT